MDTKERQALVKKMKVSPAYIVGKIANIIFKDYNEFAWLKYTCKDDELFFEFHYRCDGVFVCYPIETDDGKQKLGKARYSSADADPLTMWGAYMYYLAESLPDDILQRLTHNTDDTVNIYEVLDWGTTDITQDLLTQDIVEELQSLPDLPNWDAPKKDIVKYVIDYFGYDQKDFDADKIAKSLQDDY